MRGAGASERIIRLHARLERAVGLPQTDRTGDLRPDAARLWATSGLVAAIWLAGLVANLAIVWTILTLPQDAYSILAPIEANWYALESTLVFAIIAGLIYVYYRYGRRSKRVDYSRVFSEIPPE